MTSLKIEISLTCQIKSLINNTSYTVIHLYIFIAIRDTMISGAKCVCKTTIYILLGTWATIVHGKYLAGKIGES